jgi:hypothetical protein
MAATCYIKQRTITDYANTGFPVLPEMKSPAFQFYVKDWLSSGRIAMLSLAERGVYIQLLA